MEHVERLALPEWMIVSTMHVLTTGEIIDTREGFEKVQERFAWADRSQVIRRILQLRTMTEGQKKSIIVFYEDGHMIREFINVEKGFRPLNFA